MKFRKKPVVVEAFRWMTDVVPEWWTAAEGIQIQVETGCAFIPTLEGILRVNPGDWIIEGITGEIYPCRPDIFEKTYERVLPETPPTDSKPYSGDVMEWTR